MAREISINVTATLKNGTLQDSFSPGTINVTQTSQLANGRVIAASTSDTAYTFPDVTTMGWITLQNLDPTNYVAYGPTSGGAIVNFGKMKPGEYAILRLYPGITFRMQANTGACNVLVKLWND